MEIFDPEIFTNAVAPGDPGGPEGHKIGPDGFGYRIQAFKDANIAMFPAAQEIITELQAQGPSAPRPFGYPNAPVIEFFTPAFSDDGTKGLVVTRFDGLNVSAADYEGPTPAPKQPGGDQGANAIRAEHAVSARGGQEPPNSDLNGSMNDQGRQEAVGA